MDHVDGSWIAEAIQALPPFAVGALLCFLALLALNRYAPDFLRRPRTLTSPLPPKTDVETTQTTRPVRELRPCTSGESKYCEPVGEVAERIAANIARIKAIEAARTEERVQREVGQVRLDARLDSIEGSLEAGHTSQEEGMAVLQRGIEALLRAQGSRGD